MWHGNYPCMRYSQYALSSGKTFSPRFTFITLQVKDQMPQPYTWEQLIAKAVSENIDLEANVKLNTSNTTPHPSGSPDQYEAWGACVSEVYVDCLTGRVEIERCDILYDCGVSMNVAVDIGQCQGAFIMGIGYFLMEEVMYGVDNNPAKLVNHNTWEYKPPSVKDIPIDFRVALLKNTKNPAGVLSSKAVGEPPLLLSTSVFLAVKVRK